MASLRNDSHDGLALASAQTLSPAEKGEAVAILVLGVGKVVTLDATIVWGIAVSVGVLIPLLPGAALAWVEPDAPVQG